MTTDADTPEGRLADLGLDLPAPFPPAGVYVPAVRTGDLLFLSGHIPIGPDNEVVLGRLGEDLELQDGQRAARMAALSALATLRDELGTLDAVRRIVSLRGVVNATAGFVAHTQVVDAASQVFVDVFGEAGRHARLAVGVSSLPVNLALEIDLVAEVG